MHAWPMDEFSQKVYNDDYLIVDREYEFARPNKMADSLENIFGASKSLIRHLDYGGGSGLLSKKLKDFGWDSTSYDPFVNPDVDIAQLGEFDLITAFEVFEHVPDVNALVGELKTLCKPSGMVLFSTQCSDGEIVKGVPLTWWYAAPRNGHVSLYSRRSLALLMGKKGFETVSFPNGTHASFYEVPHWASHLAGILP